MQHPRTHRHVLLALVLGVVCTSSAFAANERDAMVQRLNELDGRLLRIERVLSNQSLLDISQRIDSLQDEVRTLRGQIEEMQHNLDATRNQQRELYADIDRRLQALEGGGSGGSGTRSAPPISNSSAPAPRPTVPAGDGNDRASYQAAFDLLKDGKYNEAASAFSQFLVNYPQSALSDNAQYWLGEAYYVLKDYPQAVRAFQNVLERFPDSRKTPDALLKLGYTQYELKNWKLARDSLTRAAQQFPDTTPGKLAQQRLAKMDAEGR